MSFPDEPQGAETPSGETAPHSTAPAAPSSTHPSTPPATPPANAPLPEEHSESDAPEPAHSVTGEVMASPHYDESPPEYNNYDETYMQTDDWSASGQPAEPVSLTPLPDPSKSSQSLGGGGTPPKPPDPPAEDEEDDGMARMSFLEHLEELRKRLILAMAGVGVAFVLCLLFSDELWAIVFEPAGAALRALHVNPPTLKLISPMDAFQIMWMKVPVLFAVFLSSPWVLYQVWAFISPGLYKKEKRYAVPFVLSSAGLFIVGGLFAYYIAFRYGLEFLLGMGIGKGIEPGVNVNEYFDLFVDVMLGVGVVFEIPILLFLLTLLHIASPAFLVRHSRYAILAIVILAAFITPTGDVFNLTLFATPMIVLFYVGIFASYILVLRREKRRFPWGTFFKWLMIVLVSLAIISVLVAKYYGYHVVFRWPLFVR